MKKIERCVILFMFFLSSFKQLHGRTREQRYTQLADWAYIAKCANVAKAEPNPVQFFGNKIATFHR